jgi:hypothetical protein
MKQRQAGTAPRRAGSPDSRDTAVPSDWLYHSSEFDPSSGHVGFVVDKVALRQLLSQCFGYPAGTLAVKRYRVSNPDSSVVQPVA